jgi:hypothetical protein
MSILNSDDGLESLNFDKDLWGLIDSTPSGSLSVTLDDALLAATGEVSWQESFTNTFETGLDKWNALAGTISQSSTQAHGGTYSAYSSGSVGYITKYLDANDAWEFEFWIYQSDNDGYRVQMLALGTADGPHVVISLLSSTELWVTDGITGLELAHTHISSIADGWHKISGYVVIAADGQVVVKVDDAVKINYSGDTAIQDDEFIDRIELGSHNAAWEQMNIYYDDFSIVKYVASVNIFGNVSDAAKIIQESISTTKQPHRSVNVSDTLRTIEDLLYPPPEEAFHYSGIFGDSIPIPSDQIIALLTACRAGNLSDTLQTITDRITASMTRITGGSDRWVAPLSIIPISASLDPLYMAAHPVRHPDRYYEPRIKSYGTFTRAIGAPVGFIKTGDGNLTVLDPDNSVRRRIAAKTILGSSAEVRLGQEGGSFTGFLRPLSRQIGVVSQPADGELSFPLQDSISSYLEQSIPGLVDLTNFPELPEGSAGEFAPIIFGFVSCRENKAKLPVITGLGSAIIYAYLAGKYANTEGGAIRAILVHSGVSDYRYLVARHPCRWLEVWRKTAAQDKFYPVSTSAYTLVTETIASGHTCQMIKFSADQTDAEIRVNAEGIFNSDTYSFVGFFGKYSTTPVGDHESCHMVNIGLIVKNIATGELIYSAMAGQSNSVGTSFADTDIPAGSHISAILIWADNHFDGVQLEYTDALGNVTYGTKHASTNAIEIYKNRFEIIPDETITGIFGLYDDNITCITVKSDLVEVLYGHDDGLFPFELFVDQSEGANFSDSILTMLTDYIGVTKSLDKIDLASFAETRTKVAELVCAGAITEQSTWGEAVSRLQRSSNIDLFADKNDRLTVHYTDDADAATVNLSDLLRLYKGTVRQQLAGPTYNQIPYRYSPNYAADKWTEDVYDNPGDQAAAGGILAEEPLQMYFVRDEETALTVVENRAAYLGLDAFRFEGEIPLIPVLEDIELSDLVTIDHFGGIKAGGYVGEQFKILELGMDIDALKYQFKGIRRKIPAPAVVTTTLSARFLTNSRVGPFNNGIEGELFGVFLHPTDLTRMVAYRSADYGVTWVISDAANEPVLPSGMIWEGWGGAASSFDCCALNGFIHVATQEQDGRVSYHRFNMSDNVWMETNVVVTGPLFNNPTKCVSIEPRYPDETLFIYFQGDRQLISGTWYERGYYSKMAGSWSSPVMVTPDPGQYPENTIGGSPSWNRPSADCVVERVTSGRNNRMHFFYSVDPALWNVAVTPDLYTIALSEEGILSTQKIIYTTAFIWNWATRNLGGFALSADRSKIYLVRRGSWYCSTLQVCDEGFPAVHSTLALAFDGASPEGGDTHNPMGFVVSDPDGGPLTGAFGAGNTIYHVAFDDYYSATAIAASPAEFDPYYNRANLSGDIIDERGLKYLTYFTGLHSATVTFRWLQIDKLPYTG